MPSTTRARITALACAAILTLGLSACGQAPWAGLESPVSATPTAKPTITAITNDLATGSARRQLTAGDAALTVDYSSALNMGEWTADASKPVTFALSATLGTDDGQGVFLSKVTVNTVVTGPTGTLNPPDTFVDQSALPTGYFMKAPWSYSQNYVMSPIDPSATSVALTFTYELLIQTTPTSTAYSKQTATDLLVIAIAP